MTYSEKLKDPRWQRKRLEIMQKADFSCQVCSDKSSTLNVHHGYYERDLDPWDYKDSTLWCLCEECHKSAQTSLRDIHFLVAAQNPGISEIIFEWMAMFHVLGPSSVVALMDAVQKQSCGTTVREQLAKIRKEESEGIGH